MRLCFLFILIGLYACGQTEKKKYSVNPKARQLNDSAVRMTGSENYSKAIALLDEAIKLDSTYYRAYANKLSFQLALKKYNEALPTAKKINMLRPEDPIAYAATGMIYEKLHDTISSKKYFTKANIHFDKILDTMDKASTHYEGLLINKAINLILLGQQQNGNALLRQLYDKSNNNLMKETISPLMNKTKEEILDLLLNPEKQDSSEITD